MLIVIIGVVVVAFMIMIITITFITSVVCGICDLNERKDKVITQNRLNVCGRSAEVNKQRYKRRNQYMYMTDIKSGNNKICEEIH
jgi:hypothetical protein